MAGTLLDAIAVSAFPGMAAKSARTTSFRGLPSVHSRYGLHTRAVTKSCDPLTEGFSHFVTSIAAPVTSGWSISPGGACTHWESAAFHGARQSGRSLYPSTASALRELQSSLTHYLCGYFCRSVLRAPNIMKRVMRCHDFGSGREERPAAWSCVSHHAEDGGYTFRGKCMSQALIDLHVCSLFRLPSHTYRLRKNVRLARLCCHGVTIIAGLRFHRKTERPDEEKT
jgi:hypothetical protein